MKLPFLVTQKKIENHGEASVDNVAIGDIAIKVKLGSTGKSYVCAADLFNSSDPDELINIEISKIKEALHKLFYGEIVTDLSIIAALATGNTKDALDKLIKEIEDMKA